MSSDRSVPLNIAVLGLGFMGSTHVKALRSVAGARLGAVLGGDERTLNGDFTAVRGNFGGTGEKVDFSQVRKYRDVDTVLADRDIDAVDICLPTDLHAPIAIAALRAGKHVLCEKPMALTATDARCMLEEAERQGRTLMIAHVLRFFPQYAALREAVRGGHLGPVRGASFRRRCAAPGWGGWLLDAARSGGGVFDLLIHDVDMCLHLFGKPELVSATGYADAARGIDCLDARLSYASGLTATISGGWFHPEAFPFSMEFTVALDGGTVDWTAKGGGLMLYAADGTGGEMQIRDSDAYAAEIGYFVECCRGAAPELCPPRESADGVAVMRLLEESRRRKGETLACRI
jgi:predicted dehydrogenase